MTAERHGVIYERAGLNPEIVLAFSEALKDGNRHLAQEEEQGNRHLAQEEEQGNRHLAQEEEPPVA